MPNAEKAMKKCVLLLDNASSKPVTTMLKMDVANLARFIYSGIADKLLVLACRVKRTTLFD